jgi:hypothetical protein
MPLFYEIPLYLDISQLECNLVEVYSSLLWFVCVCVCVVKVSMLAQIRKSWCLLLVAIDTDSRGGVECFHLFLPQ